jgi:hypothetical protein
MLMRIVEKGEYGINMCYMMVFCTVLTSFMFPLVPFTFCFCRKHMELAWWDILEWKKLRMCWLITSFGQRCGVTLSTTCYGALLATKLGLDVTHMAFRYLLMFLVYLGRIFIWTLS